MENICISVQIKVFMVCDSIYGSFVQAMFNPVAQGEFGGEIKKVV